MATSPLEELGSRIDAELQAEDEVMMAKKGGKTDSLSGKK